MTLAAILETLRSRKGLVLLAPALLLGAFAVWQSNAATRTPLAKGSTVSDAVGTAQRKDIEAIVREYLIANPEIMLEVQAALETKMEKVQSEKTASALKSYSAEIYRPKFSPVVGNAQGDVTI